MTQGCGAIYQPNNNNCRLSPRFARLSLSEDRKLKELDKI
jgi:hypothetical protein